MERKGFQIAKKGKKLFEARVDGILHRKKDDKVYAIIEVKPFRRDPSQSAIRMQEAAQMASWISSHHPAIDA